MAICFAYWTHLVSLTLSPEFILLQGHSKRDTLQCESLIKIYNAIEKEQNAPRRRTPIAIMVLGDEHILVRERLRLGCSLLQRLLSL